MNETQVKYLAGLLDADGSLSLTFKRADNTDGFYYVGLQMKLSSSDAVDRRGYVASLAESTGFGTNHREGKKDHVAVWAVTKRADLEMLLPRLTKHMVIKARHWQRLLLIWRDLRSKGAVDEKTRTWLKEESAASRLDVGPLRTKNHPTWAWLAGYLDGDGWYTYRRNWNKRDERYDWTMNVGAVAHKNDMAVLTFLRDAFGGYIYEHSKGSDVRVWRRSLGKRDKDFALRFLPHMAKHSKLKRHKIDALIHHHRQRLSVLGAAA
jgi:hypothetical protein